MVHRGNIDVPSMYRPHGRYRYVGGVVSHPPPIVYNHERILTARNYSQNWRAAVAMLCAIPTNLAGLANSVSPSIKVATGAIHLFDLAWIYGVRLISPSPLLLV